MEMHFNMFKLDFRNIPSFYDDNFGPNFPDQNKNMFRLAYFFTCNNCSVVVKRPRLLIISDKLKVLKVNVLYVTTWKIAQGLVLIMRRGQMSTSNLFKWVMSGNFQMESD